MVSRGLNIIFFLTQFPKSKAGSNSKIILTMNKANLLQKERHQLPCWKNFSLLGRYNYKTISMHKAKRQTPVKWLFTFQVPKIQIRLVLFLSSRILYLQKTALSPSKNVLFFISEPTNNIFIWIWLVTIIQFPLDHIKYYFVFNPFRIISVSFL